MLRKLIGIAALGALSTLGGCETMPSSFGRDAQAAAAIGTDPRYGPDEWREFADERPDAYFMNLRDVEPTHTADLRTNDEQLPSTMLRANRPATLSYAYTANTLAHLRQEPSPGFADAMTDPNRRAGLSVSFSCFPCRDSDNAQRARAVTLDEAINFEFTPADSIDAIYSRLHVPPHVALTFRSGQTEVDRWVIPITILRAGESPGETQRSEFRHFSRWRPANTALSVVRLDYVAASLSDPYILRVALPWRLAHFVPEGAWSEGATLEWSRDVPELVLTIAIQRTSADITSNVLDLHEQLRVTGRHAMETSGERGTAVALYDAVRAHARNTQRAIFPLEVRQLLFNLARCEAIEGSIRVNGDTPIVIALSGLPHVPVQLLPLESVAATGTPACSAGLRARNAEPAGPDFLGYEFAIATHPRGVGPLAPFPPAHTGDRQSIVGGVYREDPQTGSSGGEQDLLFDEFAQTLVGAYPTHRVERTGSTFLEALRENASAEVVAINAHGQRRTTSHGSELIATDRIIFSHKTYIAQGREAELPDSAVVSAGQIADVFIDELRAMPGRPPLSTRPVVLLLACETAPYRQAELTLPHAFLRIGASAVISTEVEVDAVLAHRFGVAMTQELSNGVDPAVALHRVQTALRHDPRGGYALLWNTISAAGEY